MTWLARWLARLTRLLRRRRFDAEARAEMQFHVEMEVRDRIDAGMDPAEARRTALRDFGGVQRYRQQVREERWGAGVEVVLRDLRFALRTLIKSPTFTLATVSTIAIAVCANTVVYTLIQTALIEPLPYEDQRRIQRIRTGWRGGTDLGASPAELLDYLERLEGFDAVGGYDYTTVALSRDGEARRIEAAVITSGVLPSLAVRAQLGRRFADEDGLSEGLVVIVSHQFWASELGADPGVIGRTLTLDGSPAEIVGVLPRGQRLPEDLSSPTPAQIYMPLTFVSVPNRGTHFLRVVGRLSGGVSPARGKAAVERVAAWMLQEFPDAYPPDMRFTVTSTPLAEFITRDVRPGLLLLAGAVVVILGITCANVASLMLARSEERRRELAVRTALGATRGRLCAQIFTESLTLAMLGGALGLWAATAAIDLIVRTRPIDLPRMETLGLDPRVLAFGVLVSLIAGIAFGIVPAAQASPRRLDQALDETHRGGQRATRNHRLRQGLVVGQLAMSLMLLVAAALLGRTLARLYGVDAGMRLDGVMTGRVALSGAAYRDDAEALAFFRQLRARLLSHAAVDAVGGVTNLPLADTLGDMGFEIEGRPVPEGSAKPAADWQAVTPGYFETMGIELLRGRLITADDGEARPGVVVINESLAARHWPGEDPLGQRFLLGGGTGPGWVEVIGVVADVRHASLAAEPRPEMYLAHEQFRFWTNGRAVRALTLVLRTSLPPADATGLLRATVADLDPMVPVYALRSMAAVRGASVAQPRLMALLIGTFAGVAVLLATVGTYGLIAYQVRLRDRELGIRMALGAPPRAVGAMVLRQGLRLAAAGLVLGLIGSFAASGALSGLLFGVAPTDPATLTLVAALLGLVALAASWVPARRAARRSPTRLLREG